MSENDDLMALERKLEKLFTKVEVMDERLGGALKRIDEQTKLVQSVQTLAFSVEKMAMTQNVMSEKLDDIDSRVETIEKKPAKRIDSAIEKTIAVIIGAVLAFLLAKLGL